MGDAVALLLGFGLPVAVVLFLLLLIPAIRGSMRPGPTQLRQDAEAHARRGQRSANRRLRTERCDDCRHAWQEHPGAPGIDADACAACRTDAVAEPCHERVPSSLLQQP